MAQEQTIEGPRPERRLRADAQRNYDRLLAAAREAVTRKGAELSMEEVARNAGVGIGTLYRHFPTRQALLEATFLGEANELREEALRLAAEQPPLEALVAWLRLQLTFGARGRCMGAAVMSAKHQEGTEIYEACARMRDAGAVLLARAQEAGMVRPDVELGDIHRMMHGIVLVEEGNTDDPGRTERMFDLVMAGLRPLREPLAG
jgi:AcrR family transcriptional regulator